MMWRRIIVGAFVWLALFASLNAPRGYGSAHRVAGVVAVLAPTMAEAQTPAGVLVEVSLGDSLTGCNRDWFFHQLGVTSRGDCTVPVSQAAAVYSSSIGP